MSIEVLTATLASAGEQEPGGRLMLIEVCYIVASIFFIIGLKWMSSVERAQRGNVLSGIGMLIAVVATLMNSGMSYQW
ncbi:MAG TPA: NAD(P)(+) transhydrogenase (Re/Si-specific) subunit beta, partial [Candidatus Hydrogenedentes bacterium]|nr:NAD(P)(+) transhydrogenase (Re/Si-specific) subunit beta [Candidatus Hydrogenedentota bacterium]